MGSTSSLPWRRSVHRAVHLLFAGLLGVYFYAPLPDAIVIEGTVRFVVFPILVVSGLLIWKGHALRRRISSHRRRGESS